MRRRRCPTRTPAVRLEIVDNLDQEVLSAAIPRDSWLGADSPVTVNRGICDSQKGTL